MRVPNYVTGFLITLLACDQLGNQAIPDHVNELVTCQERN